MCILIITKWTIPWDIERSTAEAPSIIAQMIALPLKLGSTEGKPLWDMEFQENMQKNLLMIAVLCVPWMLLIKPILLWIKMPASPARVSVHSHHSGSGSDQHEEGLDTPLNMDDELDEVKADHHAHGHGQAGGAHH